MKVFRWFCSVLRDGWTIIGLTAVCLVAAEIAAHTIFWQAGDEVPPLADAYGSGAPWVQEYEREHRVSDRPVWAPYVYWRKAQFSGRYINITPEGLRRSWTQPGASRTDPTIFMFGGSTMWGYGARDDQTIPSLVARGLADRGCRVRVTNFGQDGYVSTQEVVACLREIQSGRIPTVAVFYDGSNDSWVALQKGEPGTTINEIVRQREFGLLNPRLPGAQSRFARTALRFVAESSVLLRFPGKVRSLITLRRSPPSAPPGAGEPPSPLVSGLARAYAANLGIARALAAGYRMKVLFYWQPVLFSKRARSAYENVQAERYEYARVAHEQLCSAVRAELRGAGDFHDLTDVFRDDPATRFVDYAHLTESGNQVVANNLVSDLLELLGQPKPGQE